MQEYTINLRNDGSAVIARDAWNKDHSIKAMDEKPFLFEVGQKVVDIFSNVVTIKEILKYPQSRPGCCPEWNLLVHENGNCYRYTEIAGIYVRMVSAEELVRLTAECEQPQETPKEQLVITNTMTGETDIYDVSPDADINEEYLAKLGYRTCDCVWAFCQGGAKVSYKKEVLE